MWDWLEGTLTLDLAQARSLLLIGAIGIGALIIILIATLFGVGRRSFSHKLDHSRHLRRLRRIAIRDNLDTDDLAVLETLARHYGIQDPTRLLTEAPLCANLLRRAIHAVDRQPDLTDHDRQHRLSRYFRLEEGLERRAAGRPRRRYRRRPVTRSCMVTPVIVAAGRHVPGTPPSVPELALDRRTMGTIMDLSAGGCAVHSLAPFTANNVARLDFDLGPNASVDAIARVRHVRPQSPAGAIIHLQFTRLSREHLNQIHRYVYGHERLSTNEQFPELFP